MKIQEGYTTFSTAPKPYFSPDGHSGKWFGAFFTDKGAKTYDFMQRNQGSPIPSPLSGDTIKSLETIRNGRPASLAKHTTPFLPQLEYNRRRRYREFEKMDDYPEISCLVGNSRIFTLKWGWKEIKDLVNEKDFWVLSYDEKTKSLIPALASCALLSAKEGHSKPMVKVTLDNGEIIECTADHPFLTKTGTWIDAGELKPGQRLMPGYTRISRYRNGTIAATAKELGVSWSWVKRRLDKFDLLNEHANHKVISVIPIKGHPDVYDLHVPGYHNFICNGVVVHNTAFDIYADDCTQEDTKGRRWTTNTTDPIIQRIIEDLFTKIKLEDVIWDISRNTVKFGDCFIEMIIDLHNAKKGIQRIKILNPNYILRVEDEFGYLIGFMQEIPKTSDFSSDLDTFSSERLPETIALDRHQIVHFRLHTSDPAVYPYGKSIAAPAIEIYQSLKLMEDGMLIYRLSRAPERRIFYVDVGNLPTTKAETYIEKLKDKFKKERFFNSNLGNVDGRYNPLCLTGDTKIPLLSGEIKTIEELMKDIPEGGTFEVWASDGKKLVPAKATRPFISGKNATILKVILDNGEEIKCTPDHKFMLRDGSYQEAKNLTKGTSLFPFYSRMNNGYLQVQEIPGEKWQYAHRIIADNIFENTKGKHVHHIDRIKTNNSIDNLQLLSPGEHAKVHFGESWHSVISKYKSRKTRNSEEYRQLRSEIAKEWWSNNEAPAALVSHAIKQAGINNNNPATREKIRKHLVKYNQTIDRSGNKNPNYKGAYIEKTCVICNESFSSYKSQNKVYCSRKCTGVSKRKEYINHTVVSVEECGFADTVYDLHVPQYHNFALNAGVIVHNSFDEDFYVPIRGNRGTKIETLPGAQNLGEVDDVKYFRDKLLAALKIPKDYVVEKDKSPERKANLAQLDVKFARTVVRVQQSIEAGLTILAKRHLQLKGFPQHIIQGLKVKLPSPSDMFEKRQLDIEEQRLRVASQAKSSELFSDDYIYRKIFDLSDHEISDIKNKIKDELNEKEAMGISPMGDPMFEDPMVGVPEEGEDGIQDPNMDQEAGGQEPNENDSPTQVADAKINSNQAILERALKRIKKSQ